MLCLCVVQVLEEVKEAAEDEWMYQLNDREAAQEADSSLMRAFQMLQQGASSEALDKVLGRLEGAEEVYIQQVPIARASLWNASSVCPAPHIATPTSHSNAGHNSFVDGRWGDCAVPPEEKFRWGQNWFGQIWKPSLLPNISFNVKDAVCFEWSKWHWD